MNVWIYRKIDKGIDEWIIFHNQALSFLLPGATSKFDPLPRTDKEKILKSFFINNSPLSFNCVTTGFALWEYTNVIIESVVVGFNQGGIEYSIQPWVQL